MLEVLTLIVQLDCARPRVSFRDYFRATHFYALDAPPAALAQPLYFSDLAQTTADYMDYAVRWSDKCGAPTQNR
jgi:hypothetical protein